MNIIGKVVSNSMQDTVVVEREILHFHPLYRKLIRNQRRILAHTQIKLALGDQVQIASCRPLAKNVHFQVVAKI